VSLSGAPGITACVIARDAASQLTEVLPTLRWADEVLVIIDAATSDNSAAIAQPLADRVEIRPFSSFPAFRNLALDLCAQPWTFFVDADERVSPRLAAEVRAAVEFAEASEVGQAPVGFWVPRHNIMFGRLIAGGGWAPDYQLRLVRRADARFDEQRLVHETADLAGPHAYLNERLLHLSYQSLTEFLAKQHRYTAAEAAMNRALGVHYRRRALVGQPLREFVRRYVLLHGWRDGPIGLYLCGAMAYFAFLRVRLTRAGTG